jgi:TRAP-type uncharacterized transport system substrate-binding protein
MSIQRRLLKVTIKWVAPIAALLALLYAGFLYFHTPSQKHFRLSMTAGNPIGMRHQLAERLQIEARRGGIKLELQPSRGSEQALDWVNDRKVDVALVQGGLASSTRPNVRQVATLHIEPMHLVVKKELSGNGSFSMLSLRGKSIDLEQVGSGTHSLALAILEFVGLKPLERDPVNGYIPLTLDRQKLLEEQDANRLPDAIFLVTTLPSTTTRFLVTRHNYRLVPLPFAEALALEALDNPAGRDEPLAGQERIVLSRLQSTTIPAYTYSIEPAVPDKPLPTLGTRLLLVAHKDVPARAALELIEQTYGSEFGQIQHPPLDAKLMDLPPEFPWHEGALLYQQRNAPLLSGAVMDSLHKAVAIFAAAASGLFVLWQWLKLYRSVSRNQGFKNYITQVAVVEGRIQVLERHPSAALSDLLALRDRLNGIKAKALDEFASTELAGKDLLFAFLLHVNDVRDSLTRLIQHREDMVAKTLI